MNGVKILTDLFFFYSVALVLYSIVWNLCLHHFLSASFCCRSSKGIMAQLMRVFVVTPEGPLSISVDPKVRPCPPPCPVFHPGTGPLELTAGAIWVIRLPYPWWQITIRCRCTMNALCMILKVWVISERCCGDCLERWMVSYWVKIIFNTKCSACGIELPLENIFFKQNLRSFAIHVLCWTHVME